MLVGNELWMRLKFRVGSLNAAEMISYGSINSTMTGTVIK